MFVYGEGEPRRTNLLARGDERRKRKKEIRKGKSGRLCLNSGRENGGNERRDLSNLKSLLLGKEPN